MIELNKNPAGRIWNMIFGLCCIIDGLIRLVSLGFLHTKLPMGFASLQVKFSLLKQARRVMP